MRTWGRLWERDSAGAVVPGTRPTWVLVQTDENGFNDAVYCTALAQEMQLNVNESPFYGDRGIPAHPAVIQQVFPDWWIWQIQRRYAQYFASLIISKVPDLLTPTYNVSITLNNGAKVSMRIAT